MNNPSGKHFPAHVIGDTHDGHDGQDQPQDANMDGDQKNQQWDDDCAYHRLDRVKAHRGPCGGWAAGVMHCMGNAKPFGAVHPAMGPVKPCVMRKKIEEERKRQIPYRIGGKICVDPVSYTHLTLPTSDLV